MSSAYRLSSDEKEAVEQLQCRFKNELPSSMKDDPTLFYRFLKARNFDVDKAEAMLRKSLTWRKAFQVDDILDTFKPKEVFMEYYAASHLGLDKAGDTVWYTPSGKIEIIDFVNSIKMNDYMKHWIWVAERDIQSKKMENMKTGRNGYQGIFIANFDGMTFANATHKAGGWKEVLLEEVHADVLPAFLGGNRTDPDGNPLCKTFVFQGGRVPTKYFLSEKERYFSDMSRVQKVLVPKGSNVQIPVEVEECGYIIRWEFETKSKDIEFGLFYQRLDQDLEIVLPIQRFTTSDGTERSSYKSQSTGTYILMFDNSYSWLNSKEVFYSVTLEKLET